MQAVSSSIVIDIKMINMNHQVVTAVYNETCEVLQQKSFSLILDLTWGGWAEIRSVAERNGLPYLRLETAKHLFVRAMDDFLVERNAVDAVLVFQNEEEIDEALYWIIGNSFVRILVMSLAFGARQVGPASVPSSIHPSNVSNSIASSSDLLEQS